MTLELPSAAAAALWDVLNQARAAPDRKGTLKRFKDGLQAITNGNMVSGGSFEVESGDLEWLVLAIERTPEYGASVLMQDGDEKLKEACAKALGA